MRGPSHVRIDGLARAPGFSVATRSSTRYDVLTDYARARESASLDRRTPEALQRAGLDCPSTLLRQSTTMDAGERLGASTASSAQGDRPAPALTPLITQTNLALGPPSAASSDEDHHTPRKLEAPSAEQPRGAGASSATHSSDVPYSTEYTYTSADPSEKNGGKKEGASLDVTTPSTPRASDGMPSEKGPAQTDDATDTPRTWRSRLGDISAFLKGDTDASAQRPVSYTHLTLPTNREV